MIRDVALALGLLLSMGGAAGAAESNSQPADEAPPQKSSLSHVDQQRLRIELLNGHSNLADVRLALTERNAFILTNTLHILYNMRWHRGVWHLLDDVWTGKREAYPELSWDLLEKPPARVALASTLNRMKIIHTREYQDYIRSQKDAKDEFIRAQVAVALGFNGDPSDIPLLRKYAEGNEPYVTQSAITGLGLMENDLAKKTLTELRDAFKEKEPERSKLIAEVLDAAYKRPKSAVQRSAAPTAAQVR